MATAEARDDDRMEMLARARCAVAAVGQAVDGKEAAAPITTDAATLAAMARLMAVMIGEVDACGGPHCMGRAVDGVKLWVTRDRFDAIRARSARLEDALRRIAADTGQDQAYDMLVDWRETTATLRRLARAAIEAPE